MKKRLIKQNKIIYELNENEMTADVIGNDKATCDIIIPRKINWGTQDYIITKVQEGSFKNSNGIHSLVFSNDSFVNTIEKNSFVDSKIKSISIPASISELKEGWCRGTKQLNNILVSPGNKYFINIDNKMLLGKLNDKSEIYECIMFVRRDIDNIMIPSFIKKICSYSFADTQIKKVFIPSNVEKICEGAFYNCQQLKIVEIKKSSNLIIEKDAFAKTSIKSFLILTNESHNLQQQQQVEGRTNAESQISRQQQVPFPQIDKSVLISRQQVEGRTNAESQISHQQQVPFPQIDKSVLISRQQVEERTNAESQISHQQQVPFPQIDKSVLISRQQVEERTNAESQISHQQQVPFPQIDRNILISQEKIISKIFNDTFLLHCYLKHKLSTYSNYRLLKIEMEKEQPELKTIKYDIFLDKCKTAFSIFRAQEEFLFGVNHNFANLINDEYKKNIANNHLNFNTQFHTVQCGIIKKEGPWSASETEQLITIITEKCYSGEILRKDKSIDWIKVSKFIIGRTPKSCYDKFHSLPISQLILSQQKNLLMKNFNPILISAFTDFEENEMLTEILTRIDRKEPVTLFDISMMAFAKYYSPTSIATKYLVFKEIKNKTWPFDESGNIIIPDFETKVCELLPLAEKEPQQLMNEVNMKQFTASLSWCRNFMSRHGLSMRTPHNQKRGQINMKFVNKYLKKLAKAFKKYGSNGVINLDETFIHTYLYRNRVVGITNQETCQVVRGKKFNAKEGTTVIATSQVDENQQIPLAIVAEGRSTKCEKKYEVDKTDEELIMHSPNGWTNGKIMADYLEWLSQKMPKTGFALVLDVYKSHLTKEFKQKAKEHNVELIYVPACGTGTYQPLDISVFSVFKEKLQEYEKYHKVPDQGTKRYGFFKDMISKTWKEISSDTYKRGWKIPGLSLSSSEFEYSDDESVETNESDDSKDSDYQYIPSDND